MTTPQKKSVYTQFDSIEGGIGATQAAHTDEEKILLACRILAAKGHCESLAGQISMRSKDLPGCFITVALGKGFDEVTLDDICYFDDNLEVVEGNNKINPALRFHLWLYRARDDVNSIIHTHAAHTAALSMVGRELRVSHMDSAMLYDDVAFLPVWPGVPFADEEGKIIAETIGDKKSILLAHHGYISTGVSVEEALYLAIHLEHTAKLQVLAESIGEIKDIVPELALDARGFLLKPGIVNSTFETCCRQVMK